MEIKRNEPRCSAAISSSTTITTRLPGAATLLLPPSFASCVCVCVYTAILLELPLPWLLSHSEYVKYSVVLESLLIWPQPYPPSTAHSDGPALPRNDRSSSSSSTSEEEKWFRLLFTSLFVCLSVCLNCSSVSSLRVNRRTFRR